MQLWMPPALSVPNGAPPACESLAESCESPFAQIRQPKLVRLAGVKRLFRPQNPHISQSSGEVMHPKQKYAPACSRMLEQAPGGRGSSAATRIRSATEQRRQRRTRGKSRSALSV